VLDVVLEVVANDLNQRFASSLAEADVPVRGFASGVGSAIRCRRRPPREIDGESVDFGEVGDILAIDATALLGEQDEFVVPVLPSIGEVNGGSRVNVNADSVAAHVALALSAQKLVMMSRVPGVLQQIDDDGPISRLTLESTQKLLAQPDIVVGGMRAKLEEALRAIEGGISQVHIISGVEPQTLLREIFTAEGCGTLITREPFV
jgi:acetylglutamate kinase